MSLCGSLTWKVLSVDLKIRRFSSAWDVACQRGLPEPAVCRGEEGPLDVLLMTRKPPPRAPSRSLGGRAGGKRGVNGAAVQVGVGESL